MNRRGFLKALAGIPIAAATAAAFTQKAAPLAFHRDAFAMVAPPVRLDVVAGHYPFQVGDIFTLAQFPNQTFVVTDVESVPTGATVLGAWPTT